MARRERGAYVSVVWFIFVIVILLGCAGYIYTAQGEMQGLHNDVKAADDAKKKAQEALEKERDDHAALSALVGYKTSSANFSSQEALQTKLNELAQRFPNDVGAADKTVEQIVERLRGSIEKYEQMTKDLQTQFDAEVASRQAADRAKSDVTTAYEAQSKQASNDLNDARQLASTQQANLDKRIADLQSQLDAAATSRKEADTAHQTELAAQRTETEKMKGRVTELADKNKVIGSDENPNEPDGKVVSVGEKTGLVFVDVGSHDLLKAGVKFDVFRYGKGGEMVPKGTIEIREALADHSVAGIVSQLNRLDPIGPGDIIANPLFSRHRSKVFALLGNFPTYGSREFLENRLKAQGATVEKVVTPKCDFLLIGEKSAEPDAPELSDDPQYKLAQEYGVQVLRVKDIDRFLKP